MRSHRSLRASLAAQALLTLVTSGAYSKNLGVKPPTPEQLARRERDDWNRQVEARKAAKHAAKVSESSPVGADKEPT